MDFSRVQGLEGLGSRVSPVATNLAEVRIVCLGV